MPKKYDPKAWDPTCGRPGYYGKEAPPLQRARVLATPDSKVKSLPAYSFSTEKRPQPGLKQCWRLEMPDDPAAASHNSPSPVHTTTCQCRRTVHHRAATEAIARPRNYFTSSNPVIEPGLQ